MQNEFTLNQRVYVDHTDAGGVVYHAQYLVFLEHARTEALRARGVMQPAVLNDGVILVVVSANMQYIAPARLDDTLSITAQPVTLARTYAVFAQEVRRSGQLLCRAEIKIASVDKTTFKITPLPPTTKEALSLWMAQTDTPHVLSCGSKE